MGWEDADIVDIVHITALFNYMDRVADGLGAELDNDRNWEGIVDKLSFKGDTALKVFGKMVAPRG